jgi:hypothetical protein
MSVGGKRYVLVEVESSRGAALADAEGRVAERVKAALESHYHNSPRRFRTVDVTTTVHSAINANDAFDDAVVCGSLQTALEELS